MIYMLETFAAIGGYFHGNYMVSGTATFYVAWLLLLLSFVLGVTNAILGVEDNDLNIKFHQALDPICVVVLAVLSGLAIDAYFNIAVHEIEKRFVVICNVYMIVMFFLFWVSSMCDRTTALVVRCPIFQPTPPALNRFLTALRLFLLVTMWHTPLLTMGHIKIIKAEQQNVTAFYATPAMTFVNNTVRYEEFDPDTMLHFIDKPTGDEERFRFDEHDNWRWYVASVLMLDIGVLLMCISKFSQRRLCVRGCFCVEQPKSFATEKETEKTDNPLARESTVYRVRDQLLELKVEMQGLKWDIRQLKTDNQQRKLDTDEIKSKLDQLLAHLSTAAR